MKALQHRHYFSDPKCVLLYLPQHFSVCSDGVPSLPKHHQQAKSGKRSLYRHSRCSKPVKAWLEDVCVCVFPPVYSLQCWWCWKSSSAGSRNENLFHSWWVWCISATFLCWFRTPHAFIVILCCIQDRYELTMHSAQISWNQTFLQLLSYVSDIEGDGLLAAVIVKYLSLQSIFLFQGRWLYALLACLEKPLLPEAHSSIRQLARRCAQLRSTLVGHNPTISCKALSLCAITPCLKRPQQAMFFSFFVEIWWYLILFTLSLFPACMTSQDSQEDDKLPALNLLICLVAR